ncbi:hypothetical protein ACROAG_22970, partial [Shewanella oncorhynchi]|uniref:hypothetical protein n=1 Tax=Shewanella oncorhynchi TaxID=2726434 RepID=UPI003D7916D8
FGQLLIIHGDTLLLWRDKAYHFSAVGFFYTSIRVSQLLSEFWITDSLDRWIYVLDNKDLDIKTFKELLLYSSHCIQMLFSNLCLNEIPSEQFINKGTFPKKDREEFFVLRPDQFNEFFDLFSYILMDIYSFESRKSMHMNDNDEVVQRIVLLHEKTKETGQLLSKHINYLGRAYDPMKKLDWSDLD